MKRSERYNYVLDYFEKNIPPVETELNYGSPYELLVAVMLSAQCTDKKNKCRNSCFVCCVSHSGIFGFGNS